LGTIRATPSLLKGEELKLKKNRSAELKFTNRYPRPSKILKCPLSRWKAEGGGIKVCAVSNFIYTGRGGGFGFFNEKGSKGKKVLLQDM
jgi:hypothetical protein